LRLRREAVTTDAAIKAIRRFALAWRSPVAIALAGAMWLLDIRDWIGRYRQTARIPQLGADLQYSWQAAKAFLDNGHPYASPYFNYPPSNLLLTWPLALFRLGSLLHPLLGVSIILLGASVMMSAAAVGRRWWGLCAAVGVWFLNGCLPSYQVLILLNTSVVTAFALALSFLLLSRGRWTAGAVVLGISFGIKPLLLPVLIVFLLARKWRPFAIALAIPVGLNLIALAVVPHVGNVWSKPGYLLSGAGAAFSPLNAALNGVGDTHHWQRLFTIGLRVAVAALSALVIWWAWYRLPTLALRVITAGSAALLGVFLSGPLAEDHYMLMFVPLAMTIAAGGSAMLLPSAWVGMAWVMYIHPLPAHWLGSTFPAANSASEAIGMALVLVTMVLDLALRRRHASADLSESSIISTDADAPSSRPASGLL
jgi:arabinofuranan 3-O-arabinosyltransferase